MISAKKYFRRNHFLEKKISSKIFSGVWLVQKIHQQRKTEYGNCCWNPTAAARIRPQSSDFAKLDSGRNLVCRNPASVA
jgi:L-asparaginase II